MASLSGDYLRCLQLPILGFLIYLRSILLRFLGWSCILMRNCAFEDGAVVQVGMGSLALEKWISESLKRFSFIISDCKNFHLCHSFLPNYLSFKCAAYSSLTHLTNTVTEIASRLFIIHDSRHLDACLVVLNLCARVKKTSSPTDNLEGCN